ncbi:MAG: hypothetical protein B7Y45_01905 [Sphingomonas sp. 28-66-16]|nr:MAG: hypothetical protein B7Y45_01905 [Sphingomonas sp. 28-66-16]
MTGSGLRLRLGIVVVAPMCLAAAPPETVGSIVAVRNDATIATPPATPVKAAMKAPVHQRDVITTGPKAAAGVRLIDDTLFSIGADAQVEIDDFVFDSTRNASRMSLNFVKGAFRFASGKPTHGFPGQKAIITPAAVVGIRGTVVTGVIGPEALAYYRRIDPSITATDAAAATATLIILSDPGEGEGEGETATGGIDVAGSGTVTPLRTVGQAIFFPSRGRPALPPVMLSPQLRGAIERRAEPPGFSRREGIGRNANGGDRRQGDQNRTGANRPGQGPGSPPGGIGAGPPPQGPPR